MEPMKALVSVGARWLTELGCRTTFSNSGEVEMKLGIVKVALMAQMFVCVSVYGQDLERLSQQEKDQLLRLLLEKGEWGASGDAGNRG